MSVTMLFLIGHGKIIRRFLIVFLFLINDAYRYYHMIVFNFNTRAHLLQSRPYSLKVDSVILVLETLEMVGDIFPQRIKIPLEWGNFDVLSVRFEVLNVCFEVLSVRFEVLSVRLSWLLLSLLALFHVFGILRFSQRPGIKSND